MPGMSDYTSTNLLAYVVGKTAVPTLPQAFVALFTAVGTDANTGFTETAYTGYARQATTGATWNAPSGSAPTTVTNAAAITFPVCTASPGAALIAWALFDAVTTGNLLCWDYLYAVSGATATQQAWKPFSVTSVGSGQGGVLTVPANALVNGDLVYANAEYGGAFPTFTQSNFTGQLVVANATTDTFTVTNGGTAVWTSTTGSGLIRKMVSQSMVTNLQPQIAIGALVLSGA